MQDGIHYPLSMAGCNYGRLQSRQARANIKNQQTGPAIGYCHDAANIALVLSIRVV